MPPLFPSLQRDDPGIPVPEYPDDALVRPEVSEAIRVIQVKSTRSSRHPPSMPESEDPSTATIAVTGALAEALDPPFLPTQKREEPVSKLELLDEVLGDLIELRFGDAQAQAAQRLTGSAERATGARET